MSLLAVRRVMDEIEREKKRHEKKMVELRKKKKKAEGISFRR